MLHFDYEPVGTERDDPMNHEKLVPIGIEDFQTIRQNNYYFVDKTPFIQQLLLDGSQVALLTRPRRFGKTLLMSMLYYFFTIEHAEENRALFNGLKISTDAQAIARSGSHPVIFLSLKGAKQGSYDVTVKSIAGIMAQAYKHCLGFMAADKLLETDREYYQKILSGQVDAVELETSLSRLSEFLHQSTGRKAVILIDEYDVPVQSAWQYGFYDDMIPFMRNFLGNALKTNKFLERAVMTGVLRITKESIFSDLNNFKVYSVLSSKYTDACGFTEEEVRQLLEGTGHADKIDEAKAWYDGYHFGSLDIYNPWSILNYIADDCKPAPYWVNTSENSILRKLTSQADKQRIEDLRALYNGETIHTYFDETVIYGQIGQNDEALYTLMLHTGYLTVGEHDMESGVLRIPNREVRTSYRNQILKSLQICLPRRQADFLYQSMLKGDAKEFQKNLQTILERNASYRDTGYESFYHGMMLGLMTLLMDTHHVRSNRESGLGAYDIALIPKQESYPGVLLEFKVANEEKQLESKAREALEQIAQKNYAEEFHAQGIDSIWKYGIAFCGKTVTIMA